MGIAGKSQSTVYNHAEATAGRAVSTLSSVSFRAMRGSGYWNKTVSLMVRPTGSDEYVRKALIEYVWSKRRSKRKFRVAPTGTIDLGNFDHAYLLFKIDPRSYGFRKWCRRCPTYIRSDNPRYSNRFTFNGKRMPRGKKIDIFSIIPCKKSLHAWEDGGGHGPDIVYEIDGKCSSGDGAEPNMVRLVK